MVNNIRSRKGLWTGIVIALILGGVGVFAFCQNLIDHPRFNRNRVGNISYEDVAPSVENYLKEHNLINADGTLLVPNTNTGTTTPGAVGGNTSVPGGVTNVSVQEAIRTLVADGTLQYVTGPRGPAGPQGSEGPAGPAGSSATISAPANSGLTYSGGVIGLKPCAVNELLLSDGNTWNCTNIAQGGANDTRVQTHTLAMEGTVLSTTITDTAGRTIASNKLDLGTSFVTPAQLSNYATTANLAALDNRVKTLEAANYATQSWVQGQGYLTTAGLASYLNDPAHKYMTDTDVNSALSTYLKKSEFPTALNDHLKAGAGIAFTTANGVTTVNAATQNIFVNTSNHLQAPWGDQAAPDPNKIYIDTGTNPASEWVYMGGKTGYTTDPAQPTSWLRIGDIGVDLSQYSTTNQMNTAINNALQQKLNNLNDPANSNLNTILQNYYTKSETDSRISTASTDTRNWVTSQGYLTNTALTDYAKQQWVTDNYVAKTALTEYYKKTETDALLANKADKAAVDTLKTQVDKNTTDIANKQNKLQAGSNITITAGASGQPDIISANIDLSSYARTSALADYVKTADMPTHLAPYAKTADVDSKLANKQDKLPACTIDGQVVKYNRTTQLWECANDNNTQVDLTNYYTKSETQTEITNKGYITSSALTNYVQRPELANYTSHAEFRDELFSKLKAGNGISITNGATASDPITITNTANTQAFQRTTNHLSDWGTSQTAPDPNKIYIQPGATSSDPATQWMYNGSGDPTSDANWTRVGTGGSDLTNFYTKSETDSRLANKQDKLPTCANGQVVKYNTTTSAWECQNDNNTIYDLAPYAKTTDIQNWTGANFVRTSALNDYYKKSELDPMFANKQDKLPTCGSDGQVVKFYAAAPNWRCAADNDTTYDLSTYATQQWVRDQGYLTSSTAASTYATQTALANGLATKQNTITGAASTATVNNFAPDSIVQTNAQGKLQASGVTVSQLTGMQNDINTLKTQSNPTCADWGECNTGKTFRGKPVYRNSVNLGVNSSANQEWDADLGIGVVDQIVSTGGFFGSGNGNERYAMQTNYNNAIYGFVLRDVNNVLRFRTKSSLQRTDTQAVIIVEYTRP